jgi:hypothetical protein
VGKSALLFGRGLLRHFLYWVPGVFLGLLELVQRETGRPVAVPIWVFWLVFGSGVLLAAFLTFHELRKSSEPDVTVEVRRGIAGEIGQIINEGEALTDYWPGVAFSEEEANSQAANWWNGAGVFVETVLGPGERHIISKPISAPSREAALREHCNLLRGVLERLAGADIRVGEAELQEAVEIRQPSAYQ